MIAVYDSNSETVGPALPPRFDAFDPEVVRDPYPTYQRLRAAGALCRGGPGQWAITRHAEVASFLDDPRLRNCFPPEYHRLAVGDGAAAEFMQRILLYHDRPTHTRLRAMLGRSFDAPTVRALRGHVAALVEALLASAFERGAIEVVGELALPLPIRVVCHLLGLPADEWREVRPRAADLGKAFSSNVGAAERRSANEAVLWLRDYIATQLAERRRRPADDLLSRMIDAERADAELAPEDLVDNAVFLFFAGFETTSSVIATGCAALLDHPEELARLRAQPAMIPRAVEELMRYDAPIQSRLRLVHEPIELEGRTIRPGRLLLLLLGSANRDERRFAAPERLDLLRHPNPHLAFGGGDHYCLGAGLARIEVASVLDQLLRGSTAIEPDGAPLRNLDSPFRTYHVVPMRVRAR